MVLDGVVQQRRDDHVDVVDAVVADDPDRHPQQVVEIGLADPPVVAVQLGGEVEGAVQAFTVGGGETLHLQGEPAAQPGLAVDLGDRVQGHGHQDPGGHGVQVYRIIAGR